MPTNNILAFLETLYAIILWLWMGGRNGPQMLGTMSKYSSSSFLPPYPLPRVFSVSTNSMRSIHFTIL